MPTLVDEKKAKPKYMELKVEDIEELPDNPNEMTSAEFNALCDGINQTKEIPPIFVARIGKRLVAVDGNHRLRAARVLQIETIPSYVVEMKDDEVARIRATRMNLVRGTIDKNKFTRVWHEVRRHMERHEAMRALGVLSEKQLNSMLVTVKRKMDPRTVVDDSIKQMVARAGTVQDLATIVKAAIGDGGVGEFDYLAFQVRGSEMVLIRVPKDEFHRLTGSLRTLEDKEIPSWLAVVEALEARAIDA